MSTESLEQQLEQAHMMLFFILNEVGEPVVIPEEVISGGLQPNQQLVIENDEGNWVFRIDSL